MKRESSEIVFCLTLMFAFCGYAKPQASGSASSQPAASTKNPESCPLPGAGGDQPLATVNGQPITEQDLIDETGAQMLQLRNQEYQIRSKALNQLINKKLLAAEAQKRGLTTDKLLEQEVDSKVGEPSDAEVEGYYLAVKGQINKPLDEVKSQLRKAVRLLKVQQARQEYEDSLRAKAEVAVLLQPPVTRVSYDPARVRGNPNAPITIVEFADFQCPYCRQVQATLNDLLAKYKGQVKIAYLDFPLSIHAHAELAAEASRCAQDQGKYWEFHDAMFQDQSKLGEEDLVTSASKLGMDEASFRSCLKSGKYKAVIQQDVEKATKAGVTGTPAFFINGRFLNGAQPTAEFEKIINAELAARGIKGIPMKPASPTIDVSRRMSPPVKTPAQRLPGGRSHREPHCRRTRSMRIAPRSLVLSVLTFLIVSVVAARADLHAGRQAFEKGDYATALKELRPLADKGNPQAQMLLGKMYLSGRGVPRNVNQALQWLTPAAEHGNREAQFLLGTTCLMNKPHKDTAQGLKWMRLSAEQGLSDAQLLLDMAYMNLPDVPHDFVQADMWLHLAAAHGDPLAPSQIGKAESRMTRDQVAKARTLAEAWKPKTTPKPGENGMK
jgi:protein-disulfide isomerase